MMKYVLAATIFLVMKSSLGLGQSEPHYDCPKTAGSDDLLAPPFPKFENWYGSEALAVALPSKGIWPITGPTARIAVKLFWWSSGYEPGMETNLQVTITNLNGQANDTVVKDVTNAHAESLGGWTMLTGIDFPSPGCWEIVGEYLGQSLKFVVETLNADDYHRDAI